MGVGVGVVAPAGNDFCVGWVVRVKWPGVSVGSGTDWAAAGPGQITRYIHRVITTARLAKVGSNRENLVRKITLIERLLDIEL
jgi:hypothetical protein